MSKANSMAFHRHHVTGNTQAYESKPIAEDRKAQSGLFDGLVEAAEDTDVALVWRGLKHEWVKEVHRMGKFGNWVRVEDRSDFPKDAFINHVAESGTSSDDATFSVIYDILQATYTRFVPGKVVVPISVKERETFHFEEHVSIAANEASKLDNKDKFIALISGFNLKVAAGADAKKLGHLNINLTTPEKRLQHVEFDVRGNVMMSCASTECDTQNNRVEYELTIRYLLVASKEDQANFVQHKRLEHSYDYDSRQEVPESLGNISGRSLSTPLANGYQVSSLGIKSFYFDVSKETSLTKPDSVPHLYAWKMWIQHAGMLTVDPQINGQLFFAHSNKGWSNVGHNGHVVMRIVPVSLQFKTGLLKSCGEWTATRPFGNANASGTDKQGKSGTIVGPGNFGCL